MDLQIVDELLYNIANINDSNLMRQCAFIFLKDDTAYASFSTSLFSLWGRY